jgi:kynurenine formamidase
VNDGDLVKYFDTLSNWGRWGEDDQLGTLNYLTPEVRRAAVNSVQLGETVSLGRAFSPKSPLGGASSVLHWMTRTGSDLPKNGKGSTGDWIGFPIHGTELSHLDALSHEAWNGVMYNGRPIGSQVTSAGALFGGVDVATSRIVGRCLFVDAPRHRGVGWLEPGDEVTPAELDSWLVELDLAPRSGDIVIVRTGRDERAKEAGPYNPAHDGNAGLAAECLPWLHDHEISVLVSDAVHDPVPGKYKALDMPIHGVGIVAMGLWLLDNADLGDLHRRCDEFGRYSGLFIAAPLGLKRSTGSPINPIVVL